MNIFCEIEKRLNREPDRLDMGHYHTLESGEEAFTLDQILDPATSHCLLGWIEVILLEYNLAGRRRYGVDPYEWTQDQLVRLGYHPIPWGIVFADEKSALKVIRGRAAEE